MISISKFGEVLFGGSRFIFWTLSPVLLLFAIFMTSLVDSWSSMGGVIVLAIDGIVLLLIPALYNPKRFWWAARGVTAIVALAFATYLIDEIVSGKPWTLSRR